MNLRVLLIESEAEEVLFLQDVLREIEDGHWLREWQQIEPQYAVTWAEAERILTTSAPHAILLNPDIADKQGAETFRLVQAAAPDVPVILLVHASDEILATKLMREGAEDFLIKKQVDCGPLAHALRNAVLRHRLLAATRAGALSDPLTGLYNRAGFFAAAARDRKLAERLGRRWMLLAAEPRNLGEMRIAFGEQRRDLELVKAADNLRAVAGAADLLGRIDAGRFAIGVFDSEKETVEEAWARIRSSAAEQRINIGASISDFNHAPGESNRLLTLDEMLAQAIADLPQLRESRNLNQDASLAGAA